MQCVLLRRRSQLQFGNCQVQSIISASVLTQVLVCRCYVAFGRLADFLRCTFPSRRLLLSWLPRQQQQWLVYLTTMQPKLQDETHKPSFQTPYNIVPDDFSCWAELPNSHSKIYVTPTAGFCLTLWLFHKPSILRIFSFFFKRDGAATASHWP